MISCRQVPLVGKAPNPICMYDGVVPKVPRSRGKFEGKGTVTVKARLGEAFGIKTMATGDAENRKRLAGQTIDPSVHAIRVRYQGVIDSRRRSCCTGDDNRKAPLLSRRLPHFLGVVTGQRRRHFSAFGRRAERRSTLFVKRPASLRTTPAGGLGKEAQQFGLPERPQKDDEAFLIEHVA